LIPKTWKGGSNEAKRKAYGENIQRGYQMPHGHPLISKSCFHIEQLHIKPPTKKIKMKKTERKGTSKILMSLWKQ
jgi:hypothetical protein